MKLSCVTYSSFAAPGLQPDELEAILRVSQRNNARDGVTGMLMFNGAVFVQSIEGPAEAIERLVMRLGCDDRQCDIVICDERTLTQRIWPDWSMGYVQLDGGWLEGQHDIVDALAQPMPRKLHKILTSLANTLPFA